MAVKLTDGKSNIILGASNGKAIRFDENDVRSMGRTATGVRGMELEDNEEIVGMTYVLSDQEEILVVTEKGYGKRSLADEYRLQIRGGKGVKALNVTEKNGVLRALRRVTPEEDVIIVTDRGMVIRTHIAQIAQTRRATQGVRIMSLKDEQAVVTLAVVPHEELVLVEQPIVEQVALDLETKIKVIDIVEVSAEEVKDEPVKTKESLFDL